MVLIAFSCKKDDIETTTVSSTKYSIAGTKLLLDQHPIQLIGTNAFHVFGV